MSDKEYLLKIDEITTFIKDRTSLRPTVGLILGSGLHDLVNIMDVELELYFSEIPHIVAPTAPSHKGKVFIGKINNVNVIIMQGRLHLYENIDPRIATILIRVMKKLGVKSIINTCASGGLNRNFDIGDLMVISDHINMFGQNALTGPNLSDFGERFVSLNNIYNKEYIKYFEDVCIAKHIKYQKGVYLAYIGPYYSTMAEYRFFEIIGADAIGMSVIQEVLVAAHCGIKVLGIAVITDLAYVEDPNYHPSGDEIIVNAAKATNKLQIVINNIINQL